MGIEVITWFKPSRSALRKVAEKAHFDKFSKQNTETIRKIVKYMPVMILLNNICLTDGNGRMILVIQW